jgi:hypothetical protein
MKKLLLIAVVGFLFGLSACKDDEKEGSTQLSKAEAKAEINSFNSSVASDLQEFSSSEGLKAITDLSNIASLDDPFGGRKSTDKKKVRVFLRNKGQMFRKIFDNKYTSAGRTKEGEPFDFAANTGIYSWNADLEQFDKTGESNIIKILFPSEGSTTNNAELRLNSYEEVGFYDEEWQEYTYNPTLIDAELLVDGTEVASLNLEATWDEAGFPLTADVSATVAPFSATVSFDVSASNKNTLSASLSKNSEQLFSTSVEVLYSASTKTAEDIKTVSGHVTVKNIKLEGNIDVEGMDNVQGEDPDWNEFVDLKLVIDNKVAGKIVFVKEMVDGYEESVPYVEYTDGSKEKFEDVVEPIVSELDDLDEEING